MRKGRFKGEMPETICVLSEGEDDVCWLGYSFVILKGGIMIGKMLPGTGNSVAEGIKEVKEWTECDRCLGTGMVPHDVNNLDDERKIKSGEYTLTNLN